MLKLPRRFAAEVTLISLPFGEVNELVPIEYSNPTRITPDIKRISDIVFVAALPFGTTIRTQEGEDDLSNVFLKGVYIIGMETYGFSYQTAICARKVFPQLEGAENRIFNFVFTRAQNTWVWIALSSRK